MIPLQAFDAADRLLRDLMQSDEPFGGKIVVLGGDFRQVLPVLPRAGRETVVGNTIQKHPLWQSGRVNVHQLTHNMRAKSDAAFRSWLLALGNGELPTPPDEEDNIVELPGQCCSGGTVDDLIDAVFRDAPEHARVCTTSAPAQAAESTKYFQTRAILCPKNSTALEVNEKILDRLDPATEVVSLSIDTVSYTHLTLPTILRV